MSTRPHVRNGGPKVAQRVALGTEVLSAAVQAHMAGQPASFRFGLTKNDHPVRFVVTVEVDDAEDA